MTVNKARIIHDIANEVAKELTAKGCLIEGGFEVFRLLAIHKDAPETQVSEMRLAWMAGADCLFSSIINMLDPGTEPTEIDLERMDKIQQELDRWRARIIERVTPAHQGTA
jgi:hypothetical protein